MPSPRPIPSALLFATLVASGCIIPVGPQFDDDVVNYPPFVENSNPGEGDIFTQGTTVQDRDVAATLSDQNLNDRLYVRWLIDYPASELSPARQVREVILPPSGTAVRSTVRIQPDCAHLGLGRGSHRLVMSVSDREFLDALDGHSVSPEAPLDSVPEDANRIRVVWLLNCL